MIGYCCEKPVEQSKGNNRRKNPEDRRMKVLSSRVTSMTFEEQMSVIKSWMFGRRSKYVCVANVHMIIEAYRNPDFNDILYNADLVTADGMPLVVLMRLLGARFQNRVAGMDIFTALCAQASESGIGIFFLGSDESTLSLIRKKLHANYPNLRIAGMLPLPFRQLTDEEDEEVLKKISDSDAGLVFVALGCPKQERWMSNHRGKIKAPMLGVGAVFSVYAGIHKHAPAWIRNISMEWLFRLIQEPRRLWRRYLFTIPPFLYLAFVQVVQKKIAKKT